MSEEFKSDTRSSVLLCLFVLGLITAVVVLPYQFTTKAAAEKGLFTRTESRHPELPDYDIRTVKADDVTQAKETFRTVSGKNAVDVADTRKRLRSGEESLRQRVPGLKVEYNDDLRIPEVIGTDIFARESLADTGIGANRKHAEAVRDFLNTANELVGLDQDQIAGLKVIADYTNPDGNLSYVDLGQEINGIPVFRGEIRAGITKDGKIFRMINNLAPGLDHNAISRDFGRPEDAVLAAARHINRTATADDIKQTGTKFDGNMIEFDRGQFADPTTAEKMYFPTEPGVAVPAWRVLLYEPVAAYYVIVDTEGRMLWRKNIVNDQTQAATYNVYDSDSPAPLSPTTALPGSSFQAPIVPRVNFTIIGNEAPNPGQNNLGWITDGTNGANGHTDGNNAEAGLDVALPDGVDAPVPGSNRVFNYSYNPAPGNPAPGDDPTSPDYRNGMVVNMFYWANRYHDILYSVGFTEAARNFQNDNFGRGGIAGDRLRVEGQDSSGTNNANFLTPADGGRGRSQMYRFTTTGPEVDRDSGIDMDILLHELTHGTSNRLIGNSTGLTNNRGGGLGEGWSDFYARALLSTASENVNGIYSTGGWATFKFNNTDLFTDNYYYGIRRFPYAVRTTLGGPGNLPHNPQTFADLDPAQINNSDGAYPRSTLISNSATQVHNAGEIWCMNLLEVRARIIARLGFAAGNTRMLQLVTDGMKLTPVVPTFTQARDAILAASLANGGTDTADIWAGFAARGQGFGSSDANSTNVVVESFNLPNAIVIDPFSVSDSTGDNDGFPEPGENVLLSVAVTNPTDNTVNNVTAAVNGGSTGSYGSIASGATVTRQIPYTVPLSAACGSLQTVTIAVSSDVGTNTPATRSFRLGAPIGGLPVTFTSNTLVNIPEGQPTTTSGPASPYKTDIVVSGMSGSKKIKLEITGISHNFPSDIDLLLVGPGGAAKYIGLSDSGGSGLVSNLTFTLSDTAATPPSTTQWVAGDFKPYNSGAIDEFPVPAPAAPYSSASPGGTETFASSFGTNGAAMNGTWSLYIVDDTIADFGTMAGWKLTFEANDFACNLAARTRADFDGDGKTDGSVFRPSEGSWYLNRSTAGFAAIKWGISTDVLVPGDYDGDGKADTVVFRANANSANPDYFILNSNGFVAWGVSWGTSGDIPISGDYDGDGKFDFAIFRPSSGTWHVLNSSNGANSVAPFGQTGDVPLAMDNNNDGKTNLAVFRPSNSTWYIAKPTGVPAQNFDAIRFGTTGDDLVPADYDGDNKDDVAVFRPSNGTWYILRSSDGGVTITQFGAQGDVAIPGDYDGDGRDDIAIYRAGAWWLNRSTAGVATLAFGLGTDIAIPAVYHP